MKRLFLMMLVLLGMALPPLCLATPPSPPPTGPTLTTPVITNLGANQATLVLKSSGNGTGYFTLENGVACGTGAQIKTGHNGSGASAYHGSLPLTAATDATYTIRNLTQTTSYTACFTADDGTNLTATAATANVTTTAAATRTSPAWGSLGAAGFSTGVASYTSLAFAPSGTPYVAFQDSVTGFATVMAFNSVTKGWDNVSPTEIVASSISLAFAPNGTLSIAFADSSNHPSVLQYVGSSWIAVGSALSTNSATYVSLAFAPDGAPHVAYMDGSYNKATVKKYSGGSWSELGNGGISAGSADYISLAFAPDGTPYLAYQDNGGTATVMKYSGSWSTLSGTGLSNGYQYENSTYTTLAITPDGSIYLTYKYDDGQGNYTVTVKKYDGTLSWLSVGTTPPASSNQYSYITSAIAPDSTLYIAFQDNNHNGATVRKFDGTSWSTVGSAGLSAGTVSYTSLAFSPNGIPHLAYQDAFNSSKATVMKFKNGTTTAVSSSAWASPADQQVTYTATVSPADATGTIDFFFGDINKETVAIVNGTATSTFITTGYTTGNYPVHAVYNDNGDPNYNGSTSPSRSQSLIASGSFVILISSDKTTTNYGDSVTFTVKVNKSDATGTLLIMDGTHEIYQTQQVAGGTVTWSTSTLNAGVHSITANIDPNQNTYQPLKTSAPIALTINAIPTTTALALNTGSATPSNHGTAVTFKATVSPSNASGKVVFYDGATALNASGTTVTVGVATYTTGTNINNANTLTPGDHTITAVFTDSVGNFITSTSGTITQSVLTKVIVTASPSNKLVVFNVGGTDYTTAQTFWWPVGSSHSIGTTLQQLIGIGTRYDFASWSDGGAQTHSITTPATDTTYTVSFEIEYLVTPAVTPLNSGTTIPSVATWYPAGSTPTVIVTSATGFDFSTWSAAASTPLSAASNLVALTGPVTATATLAAVTTTLSAAVPTANKSVGTGVGGRNWVVNLTNSAATQVTLAKIISIVFSSGTSSACQPVTVPAGAINVNAGTGTIAANSTASTAAIAVNFGTCPKLTKFNVSINYSAKTSGNVTISGTTNLTGQAQ